MTDSDKKKLIESQQELEKLKKENEDILSKQEQDKTERVEMENYLKELETEKSVLTSHLETLQEELSRNAALRGKSQPVEELNKGLRANYLKVNEERILLISQLEERDAQIKRYRDKLAAKDAPPTTLSLNVQRSLSAGEAESLEDPKAEVHRLGNALKGKETEVDNLKVQLQSFQEVACGNMDLGKEVLKC